MVTKISPRHMGSPRFGLDRDEPANGEVIPYTLTKEELQEVIRKYGPPLKPMQRPRQEKQINVSHDELLAALRRNQSWSIAMKELGVSWTHMIRLMASYQINPGDWKNKEEPTMPKKEITKDEYLNLKDQGWTDTKVIQEYGFKNMEFYNQKHAWGLYGTKLSNRLKKETPAEPKQLVVNPEFEEAVTAMEAQIFAQDEPISGTIIPTVCAKAEFTDLKGEKETFSISATESPAAIAVEPTDWINPSANVEEKYTAYVTKNGITFSRLSSDTFLKKGQSIRIGVKGDKLVFAVCREKDETNYNMRPSSARSHRMKLSGKALWPKLSKKGVQVANYNLEYSGLTDLWIGTRIEKEEAE